MKDAVGFWSGQDTTLKPSQTKIIFNSVPDTDSLRNLRDRAILCLMVYEGWRRIEIHRACSEDVSSCCAHLTVRGRGKKKVGVPREETVAALSKYLDARGPVPKDNLVDQHEMEPLFVGINRSGRITGRLSSRDLNRLVDKYLDKAGLKQDGVSCYALSISGSQRAQYRNVVEQPEEEIRPV